MPAMPSVHTHKTSASSLPPEESLGCSSNILYAFVSVETVPNVPFVPIKSIMFNIINIYRLCYQSHLFHFARSDADRFYAILSWYRLYQKLYGTFGTFGTLSCVSKTAVVHAVPGRRAVSAVQQVSYHFAAAIYSCAVFSTLLLRLLKFHNCIKIPTYFRQSHVL